MTLDEAVSSCTCEVTTLTPSALLTFSSSQDGLVSEWLLQLLSASRCLGLCVSKGIEATEESKAPLMERSLLSGEHFHQTEVGCPHWGSLGEMLCFSTVQTVCCILLWLGF